MIRKRSNIIGRIHDSNNREYIATKKNGGLIIHVKASLEDIDNINNYTSNCITNINYNNKEAALRDGFDSYVKYISEDFDRYNDELLCFMSQYIYAGSIKGLYINDYKKYSKNRIMFWVHFQVDEIIEFDKVHRFKV